MRQILIVHSLEDKRFKPFFEKVFSTTRVGTVWNSYEKIGSGKPGLTEFENQVGAADGLFMVLDQEVQSLSKSSGWIFSEPGFAAGKPLWVFEHCDDLRRISIRIPALQNYVSYYITNAWMDYVTKIAETFEKSNPAPAPLQGAVLTPLTPGAVGSFFDNLTGQALFDFSTSRPMGIKTECPYCTAKYQVHLPADLKVVRCPVCNYFHEIKLTVVVPIPAVA